MSKVLIKEIKKFQKPLCNFPHNIVNRVTKDVCCKYYPDDNNEITFMIYDFCNEHNITNSAFYFRSGVDKASFSNFINSRCKPKRDTLLCILLSLELPNDIITKHMDDYGYHYPRKGARDDVIYQCHQAALENRDTIVWNRYIMELNDAIHEINDNLEKIASRTTNSKFTRMRLLPNRKDYA